MYVMLLQHVRRRLPLEGYGLSFSHSPQWPRERILISSAATLTTCLRLPLLMIPTHGARMMNKYHYCAPTTSIVPHIVVHIGPITSYPPLIVSILGNPGFDVEADAVKPTSSTWAKAQYYMPSLYWIPHYTLSLYATFN